jgi:hypothetical protein
MDMGQLLRALGLQQAYQSYQQNIGQPFANVAGPFGRGLLGLDRPEYGEEQAYRTGQAVGNMPAVSAPVGAFKAAMQAPELLGLLGSIAPKIGQGILNLKQEAKVLSEKQFLDKYVAETLPQHLDLQDLNKALPEGVEKNLPHDVLPTGLLSPSEVDDWSEMGKYQRGKEKIEELRKAIQQGKELPPVLVETFPGSFPVVIDGHHRTAAYLQEGVKTIPITLDLQSLIRMWKEENKSAKSAAEIKEEYLKTLR